MGILGPALTLTRSVVQQFLNDTQVRKLVTYKKWVSQTFDRDLGYNVDVFTSTPNLRTLRLRANESITAFEHLEAGDVIFMMAFDDLPSNVSAKDQIVDATGVVFKVLEIQQVFDIVTAFRVQGNVK